MGLFSACGLGSKSRGDISISDADKAVLQLKIQRDSVKMNQRRIMGLRNQQEAACRQLLKRGMRDRALVALKQMKHQEKLIKQADATLDKLSQMTSQIEWSQIEVEVVAGLQEGANTLKELNASVDVEMVDRLMDETAEGIARVNEISDRLAQQLDPIDHEATVNQLNQIEAEMAASMPSMHSVPKHVPSPVGRVANTEVFEEDDEVEMVAA